MDAFLSSIPEGYMAMGKLDDVKAAIESGAVLIDVRETFGIDVDLIVERSPGGLCVAIDGVYWTVAHLAPRRAHGAEAVPTVAFLLGVMAGLPWLAIPLAAFKAAMFVGRWERGRHVLPPRGGSVRLLALVGAVAPGLHWPVPAILAVIGEALDRIAFYENLEPSTPARRMAEDAQRLSAA